MKALYGEEKAGLKSGTGRYRCGRTIRVHVLERKVCWHTEFLLTMDRVRSLKATLFGPRSGVSCHVPDPKQLHGLDLSPGLGPPRSQFQLCLSEPAASHLFLVLLQRFRNDFIRS